VVTLVALPAAALAHYRQQQRKAGALLIAVERLWGRLEPTNLDGSWDSVRGSILGLVVGAQQSTADDTVGYLTRVLAELGLTDDPDGEINPAGFAGYASDGRDLSTLMSQGVIAAKSATVRGLAPDAGKAVGGRVLQQIVATQFADASRASESVGIAQRRNVTGYVRMLNLPSCSRCVILAGRHYRWSTGFARHPQCDCRHIPASESIAGDLVVNPQAALRAGQVRGLTAAQKTAITDGADLNQVVNSRRGMDAAGYTTEGVTARGIYGGARSAPRITPERIYTVAENRDDAVRLLKLYKYIV